LNPPHGMEGEIVGVHPMWWWTPPPPPPLLKEKKRKNLKMSKWENVGEEMIMSED